MPVECAPRKTLGCAAVLLAMITSVAHADAMLEGFDNPLRIPDQYTVLLNQTPGWSIDLGDARAKKELSRGCDHKGTVARTQRRLERGTHVTDSLCGRLSKTRNAAVDLIGK
jgi:hypothetical protein